MDSRQTTLVRDLAKQYADIAADPIQNERRDLWRRHNSLKPTKPLIYVRAYAWNELPASKCECEDPFLRGFESFFRRQLFRHSLNDDSILEPWVTVAAVKTCHGWGLAGERRHSGEAGGAWKMDYPIKELDDIEHMRTPRHEIDEDDTARKFARAQELFGDIITVNLDRGPAYRVWSADLSTDLGHLRGIEHFMLDMLDHPEWLHRLVKFMADGVLKAHDEAEAAGDWGMCNSENQSMAYAEELDDPAANVTGVKRSQIWGFMAAQEFTAVSPAMHDEFLLQYQLPIMQHFGLVSYGCCEDLTKKIDMLRQIPNLRRIAVTPFADAARCAEQIGRDYVVSYRPSPSDMVGYGFDEERIRSILGRDLAACKDCCVDITLKDVETVEGDADRLRQWVQLTRTIIDEIF